MQFPRYIYVTNVSRFRNLEQNLFILNNSMRFFQNSPPNITKATPSKLYAFTHWKTRRAEVGRTKAHQMQVVKHVLGLTIFGQEDGCCFTLPREIYTRQKKSWTFCLQLNENLYLCIVFLRRHDILFAQIPSRTTTSEWKRALDQIRFGVRT